MNPPRPCACALFFISIWLSPSQLACADSYTVNLVEGWNLIANHLDNGGNTLEEIMPNPPNGTIFYKVYNSNENAYVLGPGSVYIQGVGWGAAALADGKILHPGQGGYIYTTNAFSHTFTGNVHSPIVPLHIGTNGSVLSRLTVGTATYQEVTGYPPTEGANVIRLIPGPIQPDFGCRAYTTFDFYTYQGGTWIPSEPVLNVGESAWFATNHTFYFPTILTQPTNQTVAFCEPFTISVVATGTPPFCFQWRLNGTNIAGATADTYGISNATPLDAGDYTVDVGAYAGGITSQVAHVTVLLSGAPDLRLTPEAEARGFVLTTFAEHFPPVSSGNYLGGPGPLGVAFLTNGHLLVSHLSAGSIYEFPSNADGQNASNAIIRTLTGGLAGMAQAPLAGGGFSYYMCIQTGSVYEVNQQGLPMRFITNVDHATAIIVAPKNVANSSLAGHLLVATAGGTENMVWDINPTNGFKQIFSPLPSDGLAFTQDGATLLLAEGDALVGLGAANASTNFEYEIESTDGIIAAAGSLLGKAYVNCTDGRLWEVNLSTGAKTLIATCGSRGDFLYADPFDGSMLITQTDRVKRLRYPGADFFGVPALNISLIGTNVSVCWPAAFLGYHLESTPKLSPPAWSPVTNVISSAGEQSCVTLPISGGTNFFRLAR